MILTNLDKLKVNELRHVATLILEIMKECSTGLIDMILTEVVTTPESQLNNEARTKLKACSGTYAEKYDAIVEVSKTYATSISSFVRELCALDKHYARPDCT